MYYVNMNIDYIQPVNRIIIHIVHVNFRIRFGRLESLYRLDRMAIASLSTTLTPDEKKSLKRHLDTVNGRLINDWCDQCTHLTVARLSITMKVLHGLAGTVPIVTPDYWVAFVASARCNTALPDPQDFRPPIAEAYITPLVSLQPNVERRRLFARKEFVFMLHAHMERYELCVQLAGGRCCSLDRKRVQRSTLLKTDVCVVQYHPSTQSQTSEDIGQVSRFLRDNGRRTIPESEIGLALLHCSTRKYCNAEFRMDGEFVEQRLEGLVSRTPSALLAPETENTQMATAASVCSMAVDVPETALDIVYDSVQPIHDSAEMAATKNAKNVVVQSSRERNMAVAHKRRSPQDDDSKQIELAKRAKPAVCGAELLDDDSDDDLLNSISQAFEVSTKAPMHPTKPTLEQHGLDEDDAECDSLLSSISQAVEDSMQARRAPPAASTQSQSAYNTSGFLPRARSTQKMPKPATADAAAAAVTIPSASSNAASRKRAHNLLLSDSDDDSDNDDNKSSNLFQFNAASAAVVKRSRLSKNTPQANDSQMMVGSNTADSQCTQPSERNTVSITSRNSIYPNRRNTTRLLNMSVQPIHISLLSGWMSKNSIKCVIKMEDDKNTIKCESVDRKPTLKADGSVDEADRIDSKAWLDQLRPGFVVRVSRMKLASNVVQGQTGERNFKGFAKVCTTCDNNMLVIMTLYCMILQKLNYRAQTSIMKTVPVISSASTVFDF